MSIARVIADGLEIEYTDSKSGITVLHRISEKDGDPIVEDYYKGKDGTLKRAEDSDPAADPEPIDEGGETEETRILGFRFKRSK